MKSGMAPALMVSAAGCAGPFDIAQGQKGPQAENITPA
nr:cold shock domain-containing protein [Streptomyces sp. 846.5]